MADEQLPWRGGGGLGDDMSRQPLGLALAIGRPVFRTFVAILRSRRVIVFADIHGQQLDRPGAQRELPLPRVRLLRDIQVGKIEKKGQSAGEILAGLMVAAHHNDGFVTRVQ